jgi:hypothetical protein
VQQAQHLLVEPPLRRVGADRGQALWGSVGIVGMGGGGWGWVGAVEVLRGAGLGGGWPWGEALAN